MADFTIPIPAKRRVTLTFEELGGRVIPLRPFSGRSLSLYQQYRAAPERTELLLDIAETLIGGEGRLTREEIEGLSIDAIEQVLIVAQQPLAELEAAAGKDGVPAATAPA